MRGTLLVVVCAVAVLLSSQMNAEAQRRSQLTMWMRSVDQRLSGLEAEIVQLREEMNAVQAGRSWDNLKQGMSAKEVVDLVGRPERINRNMELETWHYPGGAILSFEDDRVISWQAP